MLDASKQAVRLAFVQQQLAQYTGPKKATAEYTLVVCPFHSDLDPSFRINHSVRTHSPGYGRCYGCGAKAKWDDLAPLLGLQPYKKQKPKDQFALELKFDSDIVADPDAEDDSREWELQIIGDLPPNKRWRSLPTNLLIELGAQLCRTHYPATKERAAYTTEPFLYFPCYVRKKLRGFIRARKRKVEGKPSYLNKPGNWSSRYGFFPYDYAVAMMRKNRSRTIVLVEGPRDALRLLKYGIPAMAILGTQSWSDTKSQVLELGGIDNVVLFMDGDKAGRKAIRELTPKLSTMFNVIAQRLPVDENRWDPGNCPEWMLHKLKRRIVCL